ncbi:MAG: YdiU family protein [Deltaproteobacteria bacterium]|nr:YdiU family protein [Deltaproteobacteria bacterium]
MSLFYFDNSYFKLPQIFFDSQFLTPVKAPKILVLNSQLVDQLELNKSSEEFKKVTEIFSGNLLPKGAHSLALAYAGHQFGNFVSQLGDGRALLLGEHIDSKGNRYDIQLKGSGPSKFSRRGDGRSALGPALREFLISEALYYLGIPTTRTLGVVDTGETVQRETALPGGISTRVAKSHIRIGTFEYFANKNDFESLKILADYAIERHFKVEIQNGENPYFQLIKKVCQLQASLISQWMGVGFIHGVMNTDNILISGETIDFGPCAFMDVYDPDTVFSSIDQSGRYSFGNQPRVIQWNLARFAECLLPLVDPDLRRSVEMVKPLIDDFDQTYEFYWRHIQNQKFGFDPSEKSHDSLIQQFYHLMYSCKADLTLSFRRLSQSLIDPTAFQFLLGSFAKELSSFQNWYGEWKKVVMLTNKSVLEKSNEMKRVNPCYIPRNHLVEEAIESAVYKKDLNHFFKLWEVLKTPFNEGVGFERYEKAPEKIDPHYRTYCGT